MGGASMSHECLIRPMEFVVSPSRLFTADPEVNEAVGAVSLWEKAHDQILAIARLGTDWDGDGADSVRPELIRSATRLLRWLRATGHPAPHDIYPMPDGNITLEWQLPGDIIRRIEVEGNGRGRMMTTYPDAPAEFKPVKWPTAPRPQFSLSAGGLSCWRQAPGDVDPVRSLSQNPFAESLSR